MAWFDASNNLVLIFTHAVKSLLRGPELFAEQL